MTHKTLPITLVSTVSEFSCWTLYNKLTDLGYKNVDTYDCNTLLATDSRKNRVFVFPLNGDWHSNLPDKPLSVLKKIHHKPVLGIIPSSMQVWNSETLKYCSEFLCWPCSRKEFGLRLERLANLLITNSRTGAVNQICDEFLSLNMVGSSPSFLHVLEQIKKVACCEAPVLIEGETGTGKELTARAIHYLGSQRDHPFVPVSCGAIPDSLLENELFGHKQGAFTDAKTSQEGLVSMAEGGTLFLDEVEAFSPKGQVILLRFLQDQQYRSLGSNTHKQGHVRIIAASNATLQDMVERGEFRMDLYYRLYIMPIIMPPLSRRGKDVLELAHYFLNKFRDQYNQPEKELDKDLIHWMLHYSWPGNVRELENLLHREFVMADGPRIRLSEDYIFQKERRTSPADRRQCHLFNGKFNEVKTMVISQFEKKYLTRTLREAGGNVTLAAKKAGKERRAFGKLLKKHGITKDE